MDARQRVLLVDDDTDILAGASLRLRAAGYEPVAIPDGERAVAWAIENRPDAIVLDVRMPGMDGLTTLGRLRDREETREIPVVVLSASVIDEQRSLDAGARFFLRKPYHGSTLTRAVQTALADSAANAMCAANLIPTSPGFPHTRSGGGVLPANTRT